MPSKHLSPCSALMKENLHLCPTRHFPGPALTDSCTHPEWHPCPSATSKLDFALFMLNLQLIKFRSEHGRETSPCTWTQLSLCYLESRKQWDGVQSKRGNGSSSQLYLPKIGLLYKYFNSIPAWRNNRSSRAGQLLSLPTNPTLCADPHTLWHTENIIKPSFINFLELHLPLNHLLMLEQFSLEARGTSSALNYNTGVIPQAGRPSGFFSFALDPLRDAKLIPDQRELS